MTQPRYSSSTAVAGIDGCGDLAEQGLGVYVHRVAAAAGVGPEATCWELADREATAYVALDGSPAGFPGRDAALLWDDVRGWAVVLEAGSDADPLILAYLGGTDPLPPPETVAGFAKQVLSGGHPPPGRTRPPRHHRRDLRARLRGFLPAR
ncbi:DUF6292 family protein [Prauserella muralis]|uniref:Uncharacterized protein n=1 Tax=Prauserella muralis TaxID=588067 RepID=A0A2V4APF6_9PSEU|nr:DUF6292 family protein [Prauserella muralis]PXY22482.1 hypothetical protein BAY60_21790 [Prauserella muralis]TWE28160.1 hypothetical protein FHX69_0812 [Prauserella muralis]